MHRCGLFGGVAAYFIRSLLVYVCGALFGMNLIPNSVKVCKLAKFTKSHVKHVGNHI